MKKIISGLLCAAMCLSVTTACANNGGASENSSATTDSAAVSKTKEQKLHTLTIRARYSAGSRSDYTANK